MIELLAELSGVRYPYCGNIAPSKILDSPVGGYLGCAGFCYHE